MKLTDLITPDDIRASADMRKRADIPAEEYLRLYEPYLLAIVDIAIRLGFNADDTGFITIGFHLVDAAIQHATARSRQQ